MPKIRVLIADDAVVIRRLVSNCLAEDPDIEVVGTAANGQIALAKIGQVNPDLVILDVEMPDMDGLQTLAAIRKIHSRLPVIMFSTLTERGAAATLDALSLGASDYVTKPANVGSVGIAMQRVREELDPQNQGACVAAGLPRSVLAPQPRRRVAAQPAISGRSRRSGGHLGHRRFDGRSERPVRRFSKGCPRIFPCRS